MSHREALFEFTPCDAVPAPTLPKESRRTLALLAAEKRYAFECMLGRWFSERSIEATWPRHLDNCMFEDTRDTARALAAHVRAADARETGLILFRN
jgi:hypothetical protein